MWSELGRLKMRHMQRDESTVKSCIKEGETAGGPACTYDLSAVEVDGVRTFVGVRVWRIRNWSALMSLYFCSLDNV